MPNFLLPRKSTAHRVAGIALYRALLSQCGAVPLADEQRNALKNIVRNRFKQSLLIHSIRRLKLNFEAGYEAIDYLDAAVSGNETSRDYVVSLLERVPAKLKDSPAERSRSERNKKDGKAFPLAARNAWMERPLPFEKLSGKRHVPVLVSANHTPFLRFKKPQPGAISRMIMSRLQKRQKSHDLRRYKLEDGLRLSDWEDQWDNLVSRLPRSAPGMGLDVAMRREVKGLPRKQKEPRWSEEVLHAINEVQGSINREREKNRAMAAKMQEIVDRETELFEQEKAERRAKSKDAKLQRRRVRREASQAVVVKEEVANAGDHMNGSGQDPIASAG